MTLGEQRRKALELLAPPPSRLDHSGVVRPLSALFEVTQPRVTCYRVGIRMNEPRMPALLVQHRRPGFYFRVLETGEVAAGDEIVKVSNGPERMSVAETDALLYLTGHSRAQLERALRIPALPAGWRSSFQALLQQGPNDVQGKGNPGLSIVSPPPAWAGFRPMRVSRIDRESASVFSLVLVSAEDRPLPAALPGQFVVLRLPIQSGAPPVLRSYSLSDLPSTGHYRVSIKQEERGVGSTYLRTRIEPGSNLEVSAPRGSFTLRSGSEPVVLVSAGVGATPVMAMLHAFAAEELKPSDLVALWGTQSRGASIPGRGAYSATRIEVWPQLHPVQQARTSRPKGYRFRRCRAPSRFCIRQAWSSA
jgi:hypothetical protein